MYAIKFNKNPIHGLTLIELLVVLTISSILFGLGYANFRDYARNKEMQNATEKILLDIKLSQGYALSGNKPAPTITCNVLEGVKFKVVTSTQYSIRAVCNNGAGSVEASLGKNNILVPTGYTISPNGQDVIFKTTGQGIDDSSFVPFTITQGVTNKFIYIIVSKGGDIYTSSTIPSPD